MCRGTFQNTQGGGLRSSVVLQTALEIASAMAFLHSHGIVHGVRLHSLLVPAVESTAHMRHAEQEWRTFTMHSPETLHGDCLCASLSLG